MVSALGQGFRIRNILRHFAYFTVGALPLTFGDKSTQKVDAFDVGLGVLYIDQFVV